MTTSGGTVTIDSNDFASLTGAIDGTAGTVTLLVTADSSVANATLTDVVIDLDSGVDLTLTYVQHALLGTGTNTNIVTLSGTVQDLTGNTSIESYVLASGTQTFTLGTAAQNVTTSGGTVTIDSNDFASLTGAIDGTAGTVTLQVTADSSVANATLTDVVIDLDSGVDLTLTYVQHALLGTGTNTNIVTLSGTVQDLTGNTSIESYVLASGTQTFTLGTAAQNVTTSGGTVTIDSNDFASLTGAIDGTAGTVTLQVTADSSVANATLTDVVIDLDSGVDLTLTYVQHALLGTGTDTNIVTLSGTVQDLTGNTSIESYVLASGTQTFTLGTAAQNVTTSGGTVTIDSNDFASLTGAIDGTAGTVTLQVTADSSVANATLTDVVIDLDSGVDLTLTYVQHALLGTGTNTNIVTLSGTVQDLTGNTSIESYVLASGTQTFTLGTAAQNVTTSGGTVTIDSNDFASLTGAIDGTAGTVTLQVTADSSVANATLTDVVIDLDSGVDLTLTYVQHALLGTGTNTNIVTLSGTVQDLTGNTSIESYVLASGTQTFTLGTAAQNVTTSGGTVTIDSNDFASLTGAIDGTAGTVTLQVTADSSVANATLTDVVIDLDSGVDLTLTYVQHALLGTGTNTNIVTLSGTVQDLTGNTSIESYVLASGTQTFTLGTAAQNVTTSGGTVTIDSNDFASLTGAIDGTAGTVTLQVTADSSVANATLTDVVIDLDSGVDLTLTYVQHALLGTGTDTNIVTLSGTVQDLTGNTSIESYVLASGTQTFTLGTAAQNVTTSGGTVTIDSNDFASLTGAIDGTAGTVTLQVTADSSVANATLTDVVIDLDSGVDLTLTYVQHALLGTGTNTNIVTLSGTVQDLTGNTSIESYVLASGTQTFTLGTAAQNVTTSGGTVTIDSNDFASLTGAIDGTAGTVTLQVTADSSVANATLTDVVIDLDSGVDLTLTYVQHALLGTGTNTNIVTLSGTVQDLTGNTSIESYVLASGTQTFTLGTAAQNVTTSGGTVTIDSNDFASLTGAIDGTAGTVTLQVTADSSVANATLTDVVIDLDSGVDLTLTYVQHALLGTGTNTNIVTLSGTVQDLTGNTSIESYVLASGTQTFTLGTAAQNVTTSGGTVTIDSNDFASLTGAIDGTAGTVTLQVTADSSVANATLTDVVIDLDSGVDLTLTYVQHALLGTGTDTNIVTLSGTVQDLTGNTSIESYVLASGTQTFTLGTAAQNVTGGSGNDTINSSTFTALTGTLNGGSGTDIFLAADTVSITGLSGFSGFETIRVADNEVLTANAAQVSGKSVEYVGSLANRGTLNIAATTFGPSTSTDLSGVTTLLTFNGTAAASLTLGAGAVLRLTAAQATVIGSISGDPSSRVEVTSLSATDTSDFSHIDVPLTIVLGTGSNVDFNGTFDTTQPLTVTGAAELDIVGALTNKPASITLASDAAVRLSADQASGLSITGTGSAVITNIHATLGADLDGIVPSAGVTVALSANATLTNAATIGNESLAVTGAFTLNLTAVTIPNFGLGTNTLSIAGESTVVVTKEQITRVGGTGWASIEGPGTLSLSNTTLQVADLLSLDLATNAIVNATALTTLSGTAAQFQSLIAAETPTTIVLPDNINVTVTGTATVAQMTAIDALNGTGTLTYSLSDTAANLVPANVASTYLNGATQITVTGVANVQQAEIIEAATPTSANTFYSITDTAAAVVGTTDVVRDGAINIVITGTANVAQALTIYNATNTGLTTYHVADQDGTLQSAATTVGLVAALQGAASVTVNAATASTAINMSGFSGANEVDLIINGNALANNISGGSGDDVINSFGGNDVISGGQGADRISSGSGNDTIIVNTTLALNNSDIVLDFSTTDSVIFNFGGTGELDQQDLRGNGTDYQVLAAGGALGANTGIAVISSSQGAIDVATALGLADGLVGLAAGDQFYLVFDNGTNSALFRVADTDSNAANGVDEAELLVTFANVSDADLILAPARFGDFGLMFIP
ncbi:beta strand repeat-containing protein [Sediminicoccus sp. BL-A-41-H5]|uniref:beta strand repeat-containing protein n=1 Tax=Sediminicoccus sp. BL-A-41-H5 TaxID=3421106 RepID=UPI003D664926